MNSNSSDNTSWLNEHTGLPKYLSEPKYGNRGWTEPSTNLPTSSTPVNSTRSKYNPDHYKQGIECWDYITSHNLGYLEGNIIKYITRAGLKDGERDIDDLMKALAYLKKLITITATK